MTEADLRAGYEALLHGDAAGALRILDGIDPTGRPGFDARLHGYRAQAFEALGRLEEAERAVAEAVRIARRAQDGDGLAAFRMLHQRVLGGLAAVRLAEQERARDAVLVDENEDEALGRLAGGARAAWLTRRAGALLDAGRPAEARAACQRAFGEAAAAGDPREQVFALLAELRIDPSNALVGLARAHAIADEADDMNLVTAVAKAARAVGVHLPAPEFG